MVLQRLRNNGYKNTTFFVINSQFQGVPQRRTRLFIIGTHDSTGIETIHAPAPLAEQALQPWLAPPQPFDDPDRGPGAPNTDARKKFHAARQTVQESNIQGD